MYILMHALFVFIKINDEFGLLIDEAIDPYINLIGLIMGKGHQYHYYPIFLQSKNGSKNLGKYFWGIYYFIADINSIIND